MDKIYNKKEECYGCNACLNICPTSAIHMEPDAEGFLYPVIDQQKCIQCKQCIKVCPIHNIIKSDSTKKKFNQRYFAVQHTDKDVVEKSSSGGMFTALSDCVLAHGGIVYGAAFDMDFKVIHKRTNNIEIRNSLRGSKYIQSDMSTICQMILDDLSQNKLVLFTGTPCQVASVRNFILMHKHTLENLILCDFICHGVASPKVWSSYINYFNQKFKGGLCHYEFRGKKDGWHKWKPILCTYEKDISSEYSNKKSFLLLYQTCFLNRICCYSCKFTSYERCSDITLGDFWNISAICPEMDDDTGTSQVLINTETGEKWFELCFDTIKYKECSKKDVWQPHLEYPTNAASTKRKEFWTAYNSLPFEKILDKYGQGDIIAKLKNIAVPIAKKLGIYVLAGKLYQYVFIKKGR